ncbi:MAG: hypothetical protein AAGC67_02385 [Myxococcota bacterium]
MSALREKGTRATRRRGQSMVEFSVVCFFGLLGVISILPYLVIDESDQTTSLPEAIRDNYRRYSYTVSVSELPDEYGSTASNTGAVDLGPIEDLSSILAGGLPDLDDFDPESALDGVIDDLRDNLNPLEGNPLPVP